MCHWMIDPGVFGDNRLMAFGFGLVYAANSQNQKKIRHDFFIPWPLVLVAASRQPSNNPFQSAKDHCMINPLRAK